MTEAAQTARLLQVLRGGIPGLVAIKHADRATPGIPDLSVTWNEHTSWVEIKQLKVYEHEQGDPIYLQEILRDRKQVRMMAALGEASTSFYLIYHNSMVLFVEGSGAEKLVREKKGLMAPFVEDPQSILGDTEFWTYDNPTVVARIFGVIHKIGRK